MNADKGSREAPADFMRSAEAVLSVAATPTIQRGRSADVSWDVPSTSARGKRPGSLAAQVFFVGEALIVLSAAALMTAYGRHARTSRRRGGAGPAGADWITDDPWMGQPDPPRPDVRPPAAEDQYPSWPGPPGPYALHPDHPSWPGRPDPRWPETEAALRADGYSNWPQGNVPPWRDAEPPGPGNQAPGRPGARQDRPRGQHRQPAGPRRQPTGPLGPDMPVRARTGFAPHANPAPPGPVLRGRVAEVILRNRPQAVPGRPQGGPAQRQPAPARPPVAPAPTQPAPTQVVSVRPPAAPIRPQPTPVRPQPVPAQPQAVPVWDAGSVQLATWIISEANQHAAEIRHEAHDLATTSLAGAKQEADQLVRQANEQAAATLAAAELEAAEMRATARKLSAELGGVAAYVTQYLASPTAPAIEPVLPSEILPIDRPVLEPAAKPAARPTAKPRTKPTAKHKPESAVTPGARSAVRQNARPRQLVAIRVMTIVTAALVLFALVAGTTEVALHGFAFFVFRSTGTGETGPSGLQENQGPGQPDAPGAHQLHKP